MKKTFKIVLALVLMCLVAMPIFANGSSETSTTSGKKKITVCDGNWSEPAFKQIKALWDEKYPDIELVGEFQVDNDMFNKYMLAIQSDTAPDVLCCALDWVTTLGNANMLLPLDGYIKDSGIDVSAFVPGAIDASTINGQLYGLPYRSETYALFYNKDILAQAGYTEGPKTWDEVVEIAKACSEMGVPGYGVCGTNYGNFSFQYITMLRSSGGSILNDSNTASALDSDVAIQTAELYKELAKYAPASMLENDNVANRTLFSSGKIAMSMSGIYDVPVILENNPDLNFACVMVPTANGATRESILGGWSVAIPKTCDDPETAWKFVEFITSPEVAKIYSNTFTGTAAPASIFEDVADEIVQPNIDALQYAKALPAVAPIVQIRQAIFDNLSLALSTNMSPKDAILKASDTVNSLLK